MSAKLLRIELRRNVGWWALPLLLALAGFLGQEELQRLVMTWPTSVLLVRDLAMFAGPLVGGVAAFVAGRDHRRGIEELAGTTPRPEIFRRLTTWTATLAWGVLAYVLAAAVILVVTSFRAVWGSPELWPVLVGVFSVFAQGALGYAAGHYLPSRFTAPLAAIGLFAAQFAPDLYFRGPPGQQESPLQYLSPIPGLFGHSSVWVGIQPEGVGPSQALFLLGLAVVGLAVFAVRVRRSMLCWGALASGALITAAGVASVSQAAPSNGNPLTGGPIEPYEIVAYEPVCKEGRITVCVHPAYEPMLDETARVVQRVSEPLAGLPAAPDRARQTTYLTGVPKSELQGGVIGFTLRGYPYSFNYYAYEIAESLVRRPPNPAVQGPPDLAVREAQSAVQIWLLRGVGEEIECAEPSTNIPMGVSPYRPSSTASCKAAESFAALSQKRRKEWLENNYADLRAGELMLEEMP